MTAAPAPRRILLTVSTSRYSERLVDVAMREAQRMMDEGDRVVIDVLNIAEREDLDRIGRSVGDEGFLGLDMQRDVLDALGQEHDRMARRRVEQVKAAAATRGIETQVLAASGRFSELVLEYAEKLHSDIILITRADRPFISRILFGSDADKVARLARRDGLGKVIIDE